MADSLFYSLCVLSSSMSVSSAGICTKAGSSVCNLLCCDERLCGCRLRIGDRLLMFVMRKLKMLLVWSTW